MRLPEDVALEVANRLTDMAHINGITKFAPIHIDSACKIVHMHMMLDTINWYRYMKGDSYE